MFKRILKQELMNITRDKMYRFFAFYPIVMCVAAYFLIPLIKAESSEVAVQITILLFVLMNGFIFGAVTGFTLLDDRDDHVLTSLKVSPINVDIYVKIKLLLSYVFGVIATVLILGFTGFLLTSPLTTWLMIALLSPIQGPLVALLINTFASNKVEGFVIMKMSGLILLIPIASIFVTDWKEIFLYIIPGFWPARLILSDTMPINYFAGSPFVYFVLGLIVNFLIYQLLFKVYQRKIIII
jgi:fluoroquinolone transport system permease protein